MDTAADRIPVARPDYTAPRDAAPGADTINETPTNGRDTSMWEPLERALSAAKRVGSNYAHLAILDMQRAAVQFAWLVAGGIVITVLLVTAWLAAVVALAVWLLGQGMSWPAVLGVAALLNVVAAVIVGLRLKNAFDEVPFSATMRQIKTEERAAKQPNGDLS